MHDIILVKKRLLLNTSEHCIFFVMKVYANSSVCFFKVRKKVNPIRIYPWSECNYRI